MPAPTNASEFVELIQKSGVVDSTRLSPYLQTLRDSNALPSQARELAGAMVRDGILTTFQAEQFLLGKWKRFTIGKYKVLEKIGTGGMGQVFLCEHKLMRRRVALKVLPTAKADDPAALERFYREARAVAALDHPNLVRAHDIDHEESLHFLVMEFIDGTNLHELVRRIGPIDPVRACHYIYQSARGLQYASDYAGLVHRDIKPGNILVDRTGVVKILDMGLARFFHDEEDMLTKKYDETLGTADYLAPEQAIDSHGVDIRADIYSLGATFYFLLTGSPPFAEGTIAQKLMWHQNRKPRAIGTLRRDVPAAIVAIVERMMEKDRSHRYQSPAEAAAALEPFIGTAIAAPSDSELPKLCLAARGTSNVPAGFSSRTPTPGSMPIDRVAANRAIQSAAVLAEPPSGSKTQILGPPSSRSERSSNPYESLLGAVGSGPPSPIAKQIYATAAMQAEIVLPFPTPEAPVRRSFRWLLPALTVAVFVLTGSLFLRQVGVARSVTPTAPSTPPASALPPDPSNN